MYADPDISGATFRITAVNKRSYIKNALITLSVGLALNIMLGAAKLTVGLLSDSSAVMSDAFNNLSDAAVSVVTILATALSVRAADHDHPFGHGRYEYIATFVIGAAIAAVGAESLIGGIKRIIDPVDVDINITLYATLAAAVAVKGFMAVFYFVRGRRQRSETIKAACIDSVSDVAVTSVVLICAVAEKYSGAHIDGYVSAAVSLVILVFALRILKTTVSRLLGDRPDPVLYDKVRDIILSDENVISVHDIVINDYGAAHKIAEADAVLPADMTFAQVHKVCDALERKVRCDTGVRLSIHADPCERNDTRQNILSQLIDSVVEPYGAAAHDLYIDDANKTVSLDIRMPEGGAPETEIAEQVKARIRTELPYEVIICIDYI